MLVSRWIPRCRSWMGLSPRRWPPALPRTSRPTNGRRNWRRAKVEESNLCGVTDLFGPVLHCGLCLSVEPGAVRPVSAHQHVLLQHRRQTVAYAVVHELWSLGQQHRPLTQRRVRGRLHSPVEFIHTVCSIPEHVSFNQQVVNVSLHHHTSACWCQT